MSTLVESLGYTVTDPNAFQRAVQSIASTKAGAWILSKTLATMDRTALKFTKGRGTVAGLLSALPVITLATIGAKSGKRRTSPLIGIPINGSLAVIGTNYGQKRTPGWAYNLEADPNAELAYRHTTVPVVARTATDTEYEEAFNRGTGLYRGYDKYRERIEGRKVRVFILDPVS